MVDVDDLRFPLPPRVFEHARLDHVEHVRVAVVVVADILLIEPRQPRQLVRRADVLHVPLRDHLLAVGIDRRPEHEDRRCRESPWCRASCALLSEIVEELRRVLRPRDFGRMQSAVDVHEGLALVREFLRRRVGKPLRVRQPARDLAIAIDLAEVLGRRDQRVSTSTRPWLV